MLSSLSISASLHRRTLPRSDYFDGIWNTNAVDDVTYGIPWYVDTRVIFYRSDLLANAGLTADAGDLGRLAQGDGADQVAAWAPHQYPLLIPITEWPPIVILGLQAGSPLLRDDGRFGGFSQPEFHEGVRFLCRTFSRWSCTPVRGTEISNLYQEFERGNIAMYISGPWQIGEFTQPPPEKHAGQVDDRRPSWSRWPRGLTRRRRESFTLPQEQAQG